MATTTASLDLTDLREVYLYTYSAFATTPQEVAEEFDGINTKYARQLLADLVKHDLVAVTEGDNGDVWQTVPSYDDMDLDEARSKFDTAYESESKMTTTAATPKPKAEPKP